MSETIERRKMTTEEAEAVLTLVRGGWLKLELDLGCADASSELLGDCVCGHDNVNHRLSAPQACKECACGRFVEDVAA